MAEQRSGSRGEVSFAIVGPLASILETRGVDTRSSPTETRIDATVVPLLANGVLRRPKLTFTRRLRGIARARALQAVNDFQCRAFACKVPPATPILPSMERLPEEGPSFPSRKTKRLRKGRLSTAGSRYFLTLVAHHRKSGLDHPQILSRIREVLFLMQKEGDFDLLCGTVMPDHLHLLVLLQDRLSLSQCVQKLKTKTRRVLLAANLRWQANYFDHRLRAEQTNEPFAFYIFLNPYRKKLIDPESVWAGWIGSESYRPHFQQSLIDGLFPPSSWVESESNFQDLIEVQGRKK